MPTEEFRVADSQDAAHNGGYTGARLVRNFDGQKANDICIAVWEALTDAGWTAQGGTKASFSLVLPFGLPITDPPSPPLATKPTVYSGPNVCNVDGVAIYFYDPTRVEPAPGLANVDWIATGATIEDSIDAVAAAVEGYGWVYTGYHYDADYPYANWLHLDFEAPVIGLSWNGAQYGGAKSVTGGVTSNWYWGFISATGLAGGPHGNAPAGGGYMLRARQSATSYLDLWIGLPASGSPEATFSFSPSSVPSGVYVTTLQKNETEIDPETEAPYLYRIFANQFSFFVWLDAPLSLPGALSRQLCALYPQLAFDRGVSCAAIVGNSFRHHAEWNASAAANSGFTRQIGTYDYVGLKPGWSCMRHAGIEIQDSIGRHVAQTAFVAAPPNGAPNSATGQARIVGVAWDSILVAGLYDLGSRVNFAGAHWECLGRYDGGGSQLTFWHIYPGDDE